MDGTFITEQTALYFVINHSSPCISKSQNNCSIYTYCTQVLFKCFSKLLLALLFYRSSSFCSSPVKNV